MFALLALDDVDQVLGMEVQVGEIALVDSVAQKLGVLQHQVALLAQAKRETDLLRGRIGTHQYVPNIHEGLVG